MIRDLCDLSVINGILLGNARLQKTRQGVSLKLKSVNPEIPEYLQNFLSQFEVSSSVEDNTLVTEYTELFQPFYEEWYFRNKKVFPDHFEFNSTVLFFWFMQSGRNGLNTKRQTREITLSINDFSEKHKSRVVKSLKYYLSVNEVDLNSKDILVIGEQGHRKFLNLCKNVNVLFPTHEYKLKDY